MSHWEEQEKALLRCLPNMVDLGVPGEMLRGTLGFIGMLKNQAMRELSTAIEDRLIKMGYPVITHDTVLRLLAETARFEMGSRVDDFKDLHEAVLAFNTWICRRLGVEDGRLREISTHSAKVIKETYNG